MTVPKFVLLFVKLLQQPLIAAGLGGNSCFAFRVYTRFRCPEPNEEQAQPPLARASGICNGRVDVM